MKTSQRLRVGSLHLHRPGVLITFDKAAGRAVVYRLLGIVPIRRDVLPITGIIDVQMLKRERTNGESRYGVVLRRWSDDIRINCTSRDKALAILREITQFLSLA